MPSAWDVFKDFEAIQKEKEAIASRLEAIASRLKALTLFKHPTRLASRMIWMFAI